MENPVKYKREHGRSGWFQRRFAKWALVVYRLGLGPLIAGRVLVLTTRGRKTGRPVRTPLWYVREGEVIYCLSRRGLSSQWLKNLQSAPRARLRVGNRYWQAQGSLVLEAQERDRVVGMFLQKYGRLGRLLLNRDRLSPVAFTMLEGG